MTNIVALILSAGTSSRMGIHKALLKVAGRTLLEDQVEKLVKAGVNEIFVVVGAGLADIKSAHKNLGVHWVENTEWQKGNFSSILCGLKKMKKRAGQQLATILLPIDTAGVDADTIKSIIDEGMKSDKNIVPTYDGRGGHPVFLRGGFIKEVVEKCDNSNRLDLLLARDADTKRITVLSKNILNNINTIEDWNDFIKCKDS